MTLMTFGKYQGQPRASVPTWYFKALVKKSDIPWIVKLAKAEVALREETASGEYGPDYPELFIPPREQDHTGGVDDVACVSSLGASVPTETVQYDVTEDMEDCEIDVDLRDCDAPFADPHDPM